MIKTRIKWKGKKVTLRGIGFQRFQNLKLAQVGLRSIRRRVARGIGAEDTPMPALTEGYKRRKRHSKVRDLWLTGKMLLNLSVRWASDRQAQTALTSRKGRVKALANQRRARWLSYSPNDQKVVKAEARRLFKNEITQVQLQLIRGGRRRRSGRAQFQRNSAQFRRAA